MTPLALSRFAFAGLLFAAAPLFGQLEYEPFTGAANYSIIVRHNATFAGTHVALGGIVGGNFTMKPSANMEFGNRISDGFALHVGGTVSSQGGGQIALFGNDYYFANGAGGVTLQNPGTALASSPLPVSVDTLFNGLIAKSNEFNNAASFGAVNATSLVNGNKLTLTVQAGMTNVFTVDASLASLLADQNAEVHVAGVLDGDTRLVVNYAGAGGALAFKAKTLGLNNTTYDQVIWNFTDVSTLTFTGDTFHGSIFAPTSNVVWNANDLDGQLVAANYESLSQREIHAFEFWSDRPPSFTPVPEPSTYAIAGALLLIGAAGVRRWKTPALAC